MVVSLSDVGALNLRTISIPMNFFLNLFSFLKKSCVASTGPPTCHVAKDDLGPVLSTY